MDIEDTGNAPSPGATDDLRLDTTATEAPAESAVATETPPDPEAAIDADLQAIWDKRNPARDESGRFASTKSENAAPSDDASNDTEGQPPAPQPTEQASKPAIEAPVSWPKEMKDKWPTLPPEAQELIATREREAQVKISQLGNERAALQPIAHVVEQHRDVFAKHGLPADQGINLLINAQRMLDQNPVAAIAQIARSYGVDLSAFGNGSGTQSPDVAILQSEIANLRAQLNETATHVRAQQEAELRSLEQQHLSTIDQFLDGKPLNESDFEELAVLVEAEKRLTPGGKPEQWLSQAYETFQARKPERRAALIEAKAAEAAQAAQKKAAEAKKLGSLNVRSSPHAANAARSLDDTLKEIARKHYG